MNIAVLGAGNAGFAISGHLSLLGHRVALFENEKFKDSIKKIERTKKIKLIGAIDGEATLYKVTTDMKEAVKGAEIVIIPVPAFAQEPMFDSYIEFAEKGQTIIFFPGNCAGLRFYKKLLQKDMSDFITIVEGDTMPYATRKLNDDEVNILGIKKKLYLAAIPSNKTEKVVNLLNKEFYNIFVEAPNVLYTSLNNGNCIVHCSTAVLNAGWIETSKGDFSFFWEGMSPSVCRVLEDVEKEQVNLGKYFGMEIVTEKDFLADYYGIKKCDTVYEMIQLSKAHGLIKAPRSLKDRYLSEDVPFGLIPISLLSKQFNLKTPTIDSVIHLANVLNEEDYFKKGITPSQLGIEGLSKEEILKIVNQGK
ncbi:MAG: NAD/NADP octopine/nopaline dehydrogenase family protein [Peptostreptococcales bacterium]